MHTYHKRTSQWMSPSRSPVSSSSLSDLKQDDDEGFGSITRLSLHSFDRSNRLLDLSCYNALYFH